MQINQKSDQYFMKKALEEANKAFDLDEVPVGAIITCENQIIARGHNYVEHLNDVTAHAEMQAITSAANYLNGKYLVGCTLFVTLEPCVMCAGALAWSQIDRVVYGASDSKRGFRQAGIKLHPKTIHSGGVLAKESRILIDSFFSKRRK